MTETRSQGLVAGGAALTVVAAVLPWLEPSSAAQQFVGASDQSAQSISGLGVFTEGVQPLFSGPVAAGLALVLVAVTFLASESEWADAGVIVGGAIVALVGGLWILAPGTIAGGGISGAMVGALFSPGIGIFATVLGGLLILAGGALSYTSEGPSARAIPT